jgi:hypothetical protein
VTRGARSGGGQGAKAEAARQAAPRGLLHERGSAAEAPQGGRGRPEAGAAAAAAGGITAAAGHVTGRQEEKAGVAEVEVEAPAPPQQPPPTEARRRRGRHHAGSRRWRARSGAVSAVTCGE